MLTRSLNNTAFYFALLAILATLHCTTSSQPHGDESEAEEEIPGDDPCPPEGCATNIICAPNSPCPDDDPCKIYHCDTASATCVWNILDQDGDGFAPRVCDGQDCDDSAECQTYLYEGELVDGGLCGDFIHPGAREFCNGEDEDCDGELDEDLSAQPCGASPTICGTRACVNGNWSECMGGSGAYSEVCDGEDNDCNGIIDDIAVQEANCNPIEQTGCPAETSCRRANSGERYNGFPNSWCGCPGTGQQNDPCEGESDCAEGYHCDDFLEACGFVCYLGDESSCSNCPTGTNCFSSGMADDPDDYYGVCGDDYGGECS